MAAIHVSVAEAKQHLSDLLGRVAYGKEYVTITKRGKPMAVLVPPAMIRQRPHLADARGWLEADDPFFATMDRIVKGRLAYRPRRLPRS
jgi:prevent-host-death family protein